MQSGYDELEPADLLRLARAHDQSAWDELVRRYAPVVWRVTSAHRLNSADAKDVSQHTWIMLAQHLDGVRDPAALPGWLATTARRECLRIHAFRIREVHPAWWPDTVAETAADRCPETFVLRSSRDRLLWRAFSALPERCQRLLGLLAHAPDLTYAQLAHALGMKASSVGQSRGRCLHGLRRQLAALGVLEGEVG